jgi:hypothetical protein
MHTEKINDSFGLLDFLYSSASMHILPSFIAIPERGLPAIEYTFLGSSKHLSPEPRSIVSTMVIVPLTIILRRI